MDEVKISGTDDVTIILDRPRAINSLSGEMLGAIGEAVKGSPRSIDLSGAGERGYCSGADIRELRSLVLKDPEAAGDWLDGEYDVDAAIAEVGPRICMAFPWAAGLGWHCALSGSRLATTSSLRCRKRVLVYGLTWVRVSSSLGPRALSAAI